MKTLQQTRYFSVLVVIAVIPFSACDLLPLRRPVDPTDSLKKCLEHAENHAPETELSRWLSRKIYALDFCNDILENLFRNFPLLRHRPDAGSDSREDAPVGVNGDNVASSSQDSSAVGSFDRKAAYRSPVGSFIAKNGDPGMPSSSFRKLSDIRNTLTTALSDRAILRGTDISEIPDSRRIDIVQAVPGVKAMLKPLRHFLSEARFIQNPQKLSSLMKNSGENVDISQEDDLNQIPDGETAWEGKEPPTKRSPGNLLNIVSTEVAKRRRQTLSINNALMALTDMVMEHGREKLMRNRENLRYHMYLQG